MNSGPLTLNSPLFADGDTFRKRLTARRENWWRVGWCNRATIGEPNLSHCEVFFRFFGCGNHESSTGEGMKSTKIISNKQKKVLLKTGQTWDLLVQKMIWIQVICITCIFQWLLTKSQVRSCIARQSLWSYRVRLIKSMDIGYAWVLNKICLGDHTAASLISSFPCPSRLGI